MALNRSHVLLLAVLGVGAVLALTFLTGEDPRPADEESAPRVGERLAPTEAAPRAEVRLPESRDATAEAADDAPSTVLWPLEVELELVRPSYLPRVPKGPPFGSGRTARLEGKIANARGEPAEATVTFVSGPNQGRVLETDAAGAYGATDLYPGLDIVEVSGPGLLGARREVRLRQGEQTLLNLGFGRPGLVTGHVLDETGDPIHGATVRVDGLATETDAEGVFFLDRVAPGRALVEITHPGYASHRAILGVMHDGGLPLGRLKYVLHRGCVLDLQLATGVGEGPTTVHLMPVAANVERTYPWHLVSPQEALGSSLRITELPPGPLIVRAYRSGAVAVPRWQQLNLHPGQEHVVKLEFESAPSLTGQVTRDGQLVAGATVELTAADPVRASVAHYGEDMMYLEADVFPLLPPAHQTTTTDGAGRFRLSSWALSSPYRLLRATSPEGDAWALAGVGPDDEERDLELVPIDLGSGSLRLVLPNRIQALPIEIGISGAPRPRFELPVGRELELGELAEGEWRLVVRWKTQVLYEEVDLELEGAVERTVSLPEEAILGQDEETWRRAGRNYPLG